jgi:hypothetical protein
MFLVVGGRIWIHIRMHRYNCGSGSGNAACYNSSLGFDPEPKHSSPRKREVFLDYLFWFLTHSPALEKFRKADFKLG